MSRVEGGAEFQYGNWADFQIRMARNSGSMFWFILGVEVQDFSVLIQNHDLTSWYEYQIS